MNWEELESIRTRTTSGEMTPKESTDSISQLWHLIFFHARERNSGNFNIWWGQHLKLLEICQSIYKVYDSKPNWFYRWIDSMPTELKALDVIKRIQKELRIDYK